ncbi:uncharacterized protein LOC143227416 [Tachypleus tridentatus]|uniref:uncharacterized protein LOC143227416 n=1 Tax=Tachypleus tridentatus TaxID=6853 RepID=UPI003FD3E9E0
MESDCTLGMYSLRCIVQIDNATYTVETSQDKFIYIINSSTQAIVNNEPARIQRGSQQYIELKLKGFPPMKQNLYCFGVSEPNVWLLSSKRIADDVIQCDISAVGSNTEFNLTVTIDKRLMRLRPTVLKPIEIVSAPAVLSAYLTTDLLNIHINFNTSILLANSNCAVLFEESTLQLYGLNDSVCTYYRTRLTIMLSPQAQLSTSMNLTFAQNNELFSMYNQRKLDGCVERSITVAVLQKIAPSFFLVGPTYICMGNFVVNIVNVVRAGTSGLEYIWDISPTLKSNATKEVTENNLEFSFASEEMKIYRPYVLSVYGVNTIGMNSLTQYHQIQRIDSESGKEKIYVSISGPRTVDPTKENTYFVYLETCNNSLFQRVQLNILWSVNSSDFQLPIFGGTQMTIPKYQMKGNAFYKITVSVLTNYPGLLSTNACITVKTKTAPLMAFVPSLYEIYFNQTFCLDGSLSTDLGRQQGEMKFLWICTKDNGNGCYVRDKNGRGYIRLEQLLQKTSAPSICIQGGLLNPGLYYFMLTVSKDVRNDNQTCVVILKEKQDSVEIVIQRPTEPNRMVLNGVVRTNRIQNLFWLTNQSGLHTPDILRGKYISFFGFISFPLLRSFHPYRGPLETRCLFIDNQYENNKNQCVEVFYKNPPRNGVLKELLCIPEKGLSQPATESHCC